MPSLQSRQKKYMLLHKGLLTIIAVLIGALSLTGHAMAAGQNSYQTFLKHYDNLLEAHVAPVEAESIAYNGVAYNAWARDPAHGKAHRALKNTDPEQFQTKTGKLAFWINAYNFLTIDLVTDKGERESIRNLGGLFTSPWKNYEWQINDQAYTLHEIEHDIIRPMGEPRIHFAINCAAKSCPDLRSEAYRANRLDNQLDDQVETTLKNASKGLREGKGDIIYVSKVMDWFSEDFKDGDLKAWLAQYRPQLIDEATSIRFINYDWSLNKQSANKDT